MESLKKLVIMIPCLNEEHTLPLVLSSIPKKIAGISTIETIIVDDGSTDKTVEVAKSLGITSIVHHTKCRGLAKSFADGMERALSHGADIIVNTDGDNQYPQEDIALLVQPILDGVADIVIGDRQTHTIAHFSPIKKLLQKMGSSAVCHLAGIHVEDAVSGFRAYSRSAAMEMNVVTEFSYCTETIIQAGKKSLKIASVPIVTNAKTRESRLFKNMFHHMKMTGSTMVRVFAMYEPLKTFFNLGTLFILIGTFFMGRFAFYYFVEGRNQGHIQSIIFGAAMFICGFQIWVLGLVADLIAGSRKLSEQILLNQKKQIYDSKNK